MIARWILRSRALLLLTALFPAPAMAQELDANAAVGAALEGSPELREAIADVARARAATIAQAAQYGLVLRLEGGATHTEAPTATLGGVSVAEINQVQLAAQLSQRFSFGLVAAVRVDGSSRYQRINPFPTTPMLIEIGPNYGVDVRVTLTQPLLRGAFDDVGLAGLEAAQLDLDAATLGRARRASELTLSVVTAYWELWYSRESVRVQQRSLVLAERQEADASARAERGLGADVDVLPFATRASSLREGVLASQLEERRRTLELARLLGRAERSVSVPDVAPEPPSEAPDVGALVARAREGSLEIRALRAARESASLGVRTAGESLRPRLDVDGYVGLSGLGSQDIGAPLEQVGTLDAFSAHIGVTYEAPLDGTQRRAERTQAEARLEGASAAIQSAELRVAADVELSVQRLGESLERARLAARTIELARRLYDAEVARLRLGTTTPTQVLVAEEELRSAELRAARARVDAVLAEAAIAHATGELALRYDIEVPE